MLFFSRAAICNLLTNVLILRYGLTAGYIFVIQNATKFGGQVALSMVKSQKYKSREEEADGLIYKVITRNQNCELVRFHAFIRTFEILVCPFVLCCTPVGPIHHAWRIC